MFLIIIPFLLFAAVIGLWAAISPEGIWNTTASWRYKDPEANRPSDAQFALSRAGGMFAVIMAIVMIPLVVVTSEGIEEDRKEESYRDCLVENRGDEGLLSPEDWCENLNPDGSGSNGG